MSILRKSREAFIEHDAIFERGVHALAVKRNDRVGRVADQTNFVAIKPRRATDRDQRAGWIVFKIVEQVWHQRHGVGKFFIEKSTDLVVRFCRRKAARTLELPKQSAGERAVRIWERDHHKTFARPDVERKLFHLPRTIRSGRD